MESVTQQEPQEEPTCHDCDQYGTEVCPYYPDEVTLEKTACIRHPRAREYLMADVISDLEKFIRGNSETIEADDGSLEDAVFCGDLFAWIERQKKQESIALIKGGNIEQRGQP